jgi:YNFM family putative membrane transporter
MSASFIAPGIAPGSPAYRRVTVALFLAGFATFSLLYCTQPLLPVLAATFRVSPAISSLALSLTTGALAPAIFRAGALSETAGRRLLMIVSLLAASLCNLAVSFAPDWPFLLFWRAAEGLALGGVPAVAMTYLAEEIAPASLGQAMGLYVGGSAFGGMSGRVLVGVLAQTFGWHAALLCVSAMALAASLAFAMLLPRERNFHPAAGLKRHEHFGAWIGHLTHGGLPLLFAIGGLSLGSFVTVYNYISFRLAGAPWHLNQTHIGLIFLVYLLGVGASPLAGTLADRLGRPAMVLAGIALCLCGIALTLSGNLALVVMGVALETAGFFSVQSVASAWVGRMAKSAKSHAASLYLLVYYLGSSIMGSLGGWFWSGRGWPGIAAFTGCALLLAAGLAVRLRRFD